MPLKLRMIGCLLICLFSCKEKNGTLQISQTIPDLISNANDNKLSLNKRLNFAFQADSLAVSINNNEEQLACKRIIAGLYLKLGNTKSAQVYFLRTVELAKELSDYGNLGIALNNLGIIYNETSEYDSAIKYYKDAVQIFDLIKDSLHSAQGLVNISIVLKNQGNYEEAFKINLEAVNILEPLKVQKNLASAYTNMGNILNELSRFDEALYYHQKALQMLREASDSTGIAATLNNVGNIQRNKKEYKSALSNYSQSLEIKEKLGNQKSIATTIDNVGLTYFELKDFNNAEIHFLRALRLREVIEDKDGFLTTSNRLSRLYLEENNIKKAESIALRAYGISPQNGLLKPRFENNLILFEIYRKSGQDKLAYDYVSKVIELKDSLFNSDMAQAISKMQIKYKTAQKDKELVLSKQLQIAQADKIHSQRKFIVLLVIFVLSLSSLLILLYRSNRVIKYANEKVKTLMNELNHRVKNNLQIVSDMLHLQLSIANDNSQIALIQSSINRVESMNIIHTLLHEKGYSGTICMKDFTETLVSNLARTYQHKSGIFNISVNIQNLALDIDKAIPVGLVINELITNIFKYAIASKENPALEIKFKEEKSNCKLEIIDNCEYWDFHAIRAKRNGLGLFLVETLIKQLTGKWNFESNEQGSTHFIEFSK